MGTLEHIRATVNLMRYNDKRAQKRSPGHVSSTSQKKPSPLLFAPHAHHIRQVTSMTTTRKDCGPTRDTILTPKHSHTEAPSSENAALVHQGQDAHGPGCSLTADGQDPALCIQTGRKAEPGRQHWSWLEGSGRP